MGYGEPGRGSTGFKQKVAMFQAQRGGWRRWTSVLVLTACGHAPVRGDVPQPAAGDACSPLTEREICIVETNHARLGCDAATQKWVLLGQCALSEVCEAYASAGSSSADATRCVPLEQHSDAISVLPHDVSSAVDTKVAKDGAQDSVPSDIKAIDIKVIDIPGIDTKSPTCGDGVCAATETCWLDCNPVGKARSTCLKSKCPNQTSLCLSDDTCVGVLLAFLGCMDTTCGGASSCYGVCQPTIANNIAANAVASCGLNACFTGSAGSCGDGVCSSSESTVSCPKDCKAATTGSCVGLCGGASSDCHCDPPCLKVGDCCADYAQACAP